MKKKIIIYSLLLSLGLLIFIFQLFVFEAPDGILGFIICLTSIYLIIGSLIMLCKTSPSFKDMLLALIELIS